MERRVFRSIVVVAMAVAFAGCGAGEETPELPPNAVGSNSVSVTALTATPPTVTEGGSIGITGGAVTVAPPPLGDTDLTHVELRWGEIDPSTGLEFKTVICDDTAGPACGASSSCDGFSHVYHDSLDTNGATAADHTITCFGENSATGSSNSSTVTVTVNDSATNVDAKNATPNSYTVQEDSALLTDATFSDASIDGSVFYETYACTVQFGDGSPDFATGSGCTPATLNTSHTWVNDGVYTLTVFVTNTQSDAAAQTGPNTATVTVLDHQPAISAIVANPDPAKEREAVAFSATVTASALETIQSCSWDFGDGSPLEPEPDCVAGSTSAGVAATHTYADGSGSSLTVRLLVDDSDSQSIQTKSLTVNNDAPVVTAPTSNPVTIVAFQPVDYASSFTDSPDAAWTADWDFDYDGVTFTIDATQTVNTAGAFSTSTTAPAPGTYLVAVRVTDVEGASAIASTTFQVFGAPSILGTDHTGIVAEGMSAAAAVTAVDGNSPATALTYDFDWNDDGCSSAQGDACDSPLDNASFFYPGIGSYSLRVTVTNGVGLTDEVLLSVTVTDSKPQIVALSNSGPKGEGQAITVHTELAAAAGDTYTIDYDWGDTTSSADCGRVCSHSYGDQGNYTVTVTVTDDESNVTSGTTSAGVTNVAPAASNACPSVAAAAGSYSCDLNATDVAADTVTFSLVFGPSGMTVDGPSGAIAWTPTADQSASSDTFQVKLADEDGGESYYTRTVSHADADADGLADRWEAANGVDDPALDPDGDGRTNAQEFADGTDPNLFDGPQDPMATAPANGSEVLSDTPVLAVRNATDPQGNPLTYTFEVFSNAGLTMLVASTSGVAEGSVFSDGAYHTEWTVNVALAQNTEYWWRARANDGGASGANSAVASFFVNGANEAPGMAALSSPADASEVPGIHPMLQVGNASDPDRDALTYTFEVANSSAFTTIVASAAGVLPGNGTTSWVVDSGLTDNATYFWRARATDPDGLAGPDFTAGSFFVNSTNDPPTASTLQSPAAGAEVSTLTPALSIANAQDVDGDTLVYQFEVDDSPAFDAPVSAGTVDEGGAGQTAFTTAALAENGEYYWRARAFDGSAAGDWTTATFFVNTVNDAPGQPVAQNPAAGAIVDRKNVRFTVRNTTDPDRDLVAYVFTIWKDEELTEIHEQSSPISEGSSGETSFTPAETLKAGKKYWWTATAQDDSALVGTASEAQLFQTAGGGGGGGGGCSVAAGETRSAAAMLAAFAALGAVIVVRRRRFA